MYGYTTGSNVNDRMGITLPQGTGPSDLPIVRLARSSLYVKSSHYLIDHWERISIFWICSS